MRVHLWKQLHNYIKVYYAVTRDLPIAQVDPVHPLGHMHPTVLLQLPPFIQLQVSPHSYPYCCPVQSVDNDKMNIMYQLLLSLGIAICHIRKPLVDKP